LLLLTLLILEGVEVTLFVLLEAGGAILLALLVTWFVLGELLPCAPCVTGDELLVEAPLLFLLGVTGAVEKDTE
jgi:hypothetical protein